LARTGSEVAESRKKLKRSQAALARNAGIGWATVEALENGRAGESGFAKVTKLLAAVGLEVWTDAAETGLLDREGARGSTFA